MQGHERTHTNDLLPSRRDVYATLCRVDETGGGRGDDDTGGEGVLMSVDARHLRALWRSIPRHIRY